MLVVGRSHSGVEEQGAYVAFTREAQHRGRAASLKALSGKEAGP